MRECLQQGVSGTGLDNAGNTPLYWASHAGHVDCVGELLALPKPAVNAQVSDGVTRWNQLSTVKPPTEVVLTV
jgi:ankyrin repeat protein